ncbi:MAG: polysaccharide biosynthesis protein [Clostridia bacterium]|nr:polysaccharide biosynthesis protein [Clostridia bacterium]
MEFRDVCIDTLGALTGILVIYIIYRIYKKVKQKNKEEKHITKDTKILFISSTGGHFSELMQLKPIMEKCTYHIVTEKTKQNINLKDKYGKNLDFLIYETKKKPLKYIFVLLANSFISLFVYLKFRPQVVITTGTHTAGPMCCIARILGSKVIYIETYANRTSKTSAGKLLYYVANDFIVQWEEMKKLYPKAKYFGGIY